MENPARDLVEKKKPVIEQHFSHVKLLVARLSLCCFELCFSCLSSVIMSISQSIERLYDLKVGTTPVEDGAPHEKPHKPLLLPANSFEFLSKSFSSMKRQRPTLSITDAGNLRHTIHRPCQLHLKSPHFIKEPNAKESRNCRL
jgi:hypothetical protein